MPKFDPTKFTVTAPKPLPVILLLDTSGSMHGEKIQNLNQAVKDMLDAFRDTQTNEIEIHVAIITFGNEVTLHQSLARAGMIQWCDLSTSGATPLGTALQMAKAMIEDKDVIPSRAYRPTVVLVSDGQPTDSWQQPLADFVNNGRSSKCDRMAMAIGADADEVVLGKFIEGTNHRLNFAENAKQMKDFFRFVTMSVTSRQLSQDPNALPEPTKLAVNPITIEARTKKSKHPIVNENPDTKPTAEQAVEGYW